MYSLQTQPQRTQNHFAPLIMEEKKEVLQPTATPVKKTLTKEELAKKRARERALAEQKRKYFEFYDDVKHDGAKEW